MTPELKLYCQRCPSMPSVSTVSTGSHHVQLKSSNTSTPPPSFGSSDPFIHLAHTHKPLTLVNVEMMEV